MNQVFFFLRALTSLTFLIGSFIEFSRSSIYVGMAALSISIVIAIPVFKVLFRQEKLLPASQLFKNFDGFKAVDWSRAFFGFMLAGAGMGGLVYNDILSPGVLAAGLFLLSPLSQKVFTYGDGIIPSHAKLSWNFTIAMLVLQRTMGIILLLTGYAVLLTMNEIGLGIFLSIAGLILLFIRQIKKLITGNNSNYKPFAGSSVNGSKAVGSYGAAPGVQPSVEDLAALKIEYLQLNTLPAQKRGYAFQKFLQRFFDAHHIAAKGAFRLTGEEIDGSFELDDSTYLLEAKWQAKPCNQGELLIFNGKVEGKSAWSRGLFISHAGFTGDGLRAFAHGKRTSIIGMDENDLLIILEGHVSLAAAIKAKARSAAEKNEFFVPLSKLLVLS